MAPISAIPVHSQPGSEGSDRPGGGALAWPGGVAVTGDSLQALTPPGHGLVFAEGLLAAAG